MDNTNYLRVEGELNPPEFKTEEVQKLSDEEKRIARNQRKAARQKARKLMTKKQTDLAHKQSKKVERNQRADKRKMEKRAGMNRAAMTGNYHPWKTDPELHKVKHSTKKEGKPQGRTMEKKKRRAPLSNEGYLLTPDQQIN
jgi:ElaB/YqjD/DUF883 family membrane-anchored ribosome-binding protein